MNTPIIHINTAFLPVYSVSAAYILFVTGTILKNPRVKAVSYSFYLLNALFTTITCSFGGASVRKVETLPGVNTGMMHFHQWTAMTAFLLSGMMAWFAYRALKGKTLSRNNMFFTIMSLFFIILFVITTFSAFDIR